MTTKSILQHSAVNQLNSASHNYRKRAIYVTILLHIKA